MIVNYVTDGQTVVAIGSDILLYVVGKTLGVIKFVLRY